MLPLLLLPRGKPVLTNSPPLPSQTDPPTPLIETDKITPLLSHGLNSISFLCTSLERCGSKGNTGGWFTPSHLITLPRGGGRMAGVQSCCKSSLSEYRLTLVSLSTMHEHRNSAVGERELECLCEADKQLFA